MDKANMSSNLQLVSLWHNYWYTNRIKDNSLRHLIDTMRDIS